MQTGHTIIRTIQMMEVMSYEKTTNCSSGMSRGWSHRICSGIFNTETLLKDLILKLSLQTSLVVFGNVCGNVFKRIIIVQFRVVSQEDFVFSVYINKSARCFLAIFHKKL